MKTLKTFLFAVLVLIMSYFVLFSDLPEKPIQVATQTIQKILNQSGPLSGKSSTQVEPSYNSQPEVTAQTDLIELRNWITTEASSMDSKSYDPLVTEAQLIQRAQSLSLQQIEFLKELVLNVEPSGVANERILSVYLLTKAQNLALGALKEIANQPLSKPGPHEVHSLDETVSMHEKAMKRMAIDDFFKRAVVDPSLRESLYQMIQGIQVPELKSYALNRFKELFGSN
jgi:hypothetical protein